MDAIQTWPQAAVAIAPMICLSFVAWCFFRAL